MEPSPRAYRLHHRHFAVGGLGSSRTRPLAGAAVAAGLWVFDDATPEDRGAVLARVKAAIQRRLWARAQCHSEGSGLGQGAYTRTLHLFLRRLQAEGRKEEGSALHLVAVGGCWPPLRVAQRYPAEPAGSRRCGAPCESAAHRYYECP